MMPQRKSHLHAAERMSGYSGKMGEYSGKMGEGKYSGKMGEGKKHNIINGRYLGQSFTIRHITSVYGVESVPVFFATICRGKTPLAGQIGGPEPLPRLN